MVLIILRTETAVFSNRLNVTVQQMPAPPPLPHKTTEKLKPLRMNRSYTPVQYWFRIKDYGQLRINATLTSALTWTLTSALTSARGDLNSRLPLYTSSIYLYQPCKYCLAGFPQVGSSDVLGFGQDSIALQKIWVRPPGKRVTGSNVVMLISYETARSYHHKLPVCRLPHTVYLIYKDQPWDQ